MLLLISNQWNFFSRLMKIRHLFNPKTANTEMSLAEDSEPEIVCGPIRQHIQRFLRICKFISKEVKLRLMHSIKVITARYEEAVVE